MPWQPDLMAPRDEPGPPGSEPLLRTAVVCDGRRTGPREALVQAHERPVADLAMLPEAALRVRAPLPPAPETSARPARASADPRERLAARFGAATPMTHAGR
ncbi:hypothetical protein [Streptomyces sp. NPDC018610]|uniref:hypothetical protein n=1 Tax=Streptomyces sp. NPDC018610 TaxID=3365049 RepID=UPI0037AF68D1